MKKHFHTTASHYDITTSYFIQMSYFCSTPLFSTIGPKLFPKFTHKNRYHTHRWTLAAVTLDLLKPEQVHSFGREAAKKKLRRFRFQGFPPLNLIVIF